MTTYQDTLTANRRAAATVGRRLADRMPGWAYHDPDETCWAPRLVRDDLAAVMISVDNGRMIFRGMRPAHADRDCGCYYDWPETKITVAAGATVEVMARHITSRLLPTYLPQYTRALTEVQEGLARRATIAAAVEQLQQLIPEPFRTSWQGESDSVRWYGTPTCPDVHGRIRVLDQDTMDLTIERAPTDAVTRMLQALLSPGDAAGR
jgi:hypothetical protein